MSLIVPPDNRTERPRPRTPPRQWKWSQQWREVLFLHWPASYDWLRQRLPSSLEVDAYDGQPWVSFVGFHLESMRHRLCPPVPFLSKCLELNLRTYVRCGDEPGIYFLSMHADSWTIVTAARCMTPLPYTLGSLEHVVRADEHQFICRTTDQTVLAATFHPHASSFLAPVHSLDAWLVERYVAFVADTRGRLYRMPVEHSPWRIQDITLQACEHNLEDALECRGRPALAHYSAGVSSLLWPLRQQS